MSEKVQLHEEEGALPTNINPGMVERRKQWKLKRVIASGVLLLAFWHVGHGIRTVYTSHKSDASPSVHCGGETTNILQGYYDRVTGSQSVSGSWANANEHGKHDKHKHHDDKHHKHDKHDHDHDHHDHHDHHHKDKHGKGKHGPGHGGKGPGHHGPPKWISPEEAEEIFLTVPTNDSIRA